MLSLGEAGAEGGSASRKAAPPLHTTASAVVLTDKTHAPRPPPALLRCTALCSGSPAPPRSLAGRSHRLARASSASTPMTLTTSELRAGDGW